KTGMIISKDETHLPPKFQDVFGFTLVELAQTNDKIIGITPAMPTGSSMKYMMEAFPERSFDVGIAEQHAVTMAAGMTTQGMVVFCSIYSTFMQRAYDQIIHDVAIQNLPVIFCLDRAGLVGEDGATHHGVFDLAYLNCIPNLIICAPKDEIELRNIMFTASLGLESPIAIRYPRGRGEILAWKKPFEKINIGVCECLTKGTEIAILSTGTIATNVQKALKQVSKYKRVSHYHFAFVKPLDESGLHTIFKTYRKIITIEDGVIMGGFGSKINSFAVSHSFANKIVNLGIPDNFIEHGSVQELQQICKIDVQSIQDTILSL
ncbi:MAG TPA: 1-deoxy-D-xylulose-5-phosphate synthase, partial [Flavobacterium sp.]|nr:1-deoxy-D-xylulose-5-phosphate synthase [Flavobacterium sp.]